MFERYSGMMRQPDEPTEFGGGPLFDEALLRAAQQSAYEEAVNELPMQAQEEEAKKSLKKKGSKSLEPVKKKLADARKPRLRTVEQYLCDQCDKVIAKPTDGFLVHGNIYIADPSCRGGLIGNNFPEVGPDESIKPESVKQTVLCKICFCKACGIEQPTTSFLKEKNVRNIEGVYAALGEAVGRSRY